MTNRDDNETGRRIGGLDGLFPDHTAPEELEETVVEALTEAGMLAPASTSATLGDDRARRPASARDRSAVGSMMRIAAALGLLALGWSAGRLAAPDMSGTTDEPHFMMLLWEDAGFSVDQAPEDIAAAYANWALEASARGTTVTGNELDPARSFAGSLADADRPGGRSGSMIGGYFLVTAPDLETVEALAETHPHVSNGGWIEVAPIVVR